MNNAVNQNTPTLLPPSIYISMAGVSFWATHKLWTYGQQGHDAAAFGAFALGAAGVSLLFKGLSAWEYRWAIRKAQKAARKTSTTHGRARFGTKLDARKAKMFKKGRLFLGRLRGRNLYYPGEAHLMTIAPAGAGKGTCIVVPNLLTYSGSMIVSDPKGELTAMTARYRAEHLGHRIIVLNPWREKLTKELELDLGDDGFNPLSIVQPGPDVKDEAELVASLLLPGEARMSGAQEFFTEFGRAILTTGILYLVSQDVPQLATLPALRRLIMVQSDFEKHLEIMMRTSAFSGVIEEYAGKLIGTLTNAPEEFQAGMSTAQKALKIYDPHGPLGKHVSRGTSHFTSIKDQPTTIYIIMPSDRAFTHASWLNMVTSQAIEVVGRDRTSRRVVFLLDEFANLGYLPNVLRGMAQYRGQGVQMFLFIQQLSMLRKIYGEGWREFFGLSEMINTFGIWEPETLKLFSELTGQETVKDVSHTLRPGFGANRQFEASYGASDRAAPLMRPEDIRTMPDDKQLIYYRNLPPFYADKVSYLKNRAWRKLADPNPYHRR